MNVLVTGVTSMLGRLVARGLAEEGHRVLGLDRRAWRDAPEGVRMFQVDVRKRSAEEIFRSERPDAAIHMATVTHLLHRSPDRFRINLEGTRAIVEHCEHYNVPRLVVVGRHTYYGAAPDSALYHTEDEPPVAIHQFPELADLVAADLYAGSALWRYPQIDTSVLRLCYTLGPSRHGTLGSYLGGRRVPTVLGYDPLFQFLHEEDAAQAIITAALRPMRGVFNVSGPPPVPLSIIIRETGRRSVPVPEFFMNRTLGRFGLPRLPRGAIDHLKYPIVVDSTPFRKATGFTHRFDEAATMNAFEMAI